MFHRVTLQTCTEALDSYGTPTLTWTTKATVWAQIEPLSARELFAARQVQATTTHQIRIRYYAGLTTKWRLLHDGRTFNIDSAINTNEAGIEWVLLCTEVTA
jgi:SPP1 family predicted phage head-tail adaptor